MSPARWFNLGLRGLMETGIVAGFAYWGVHTGSGTASKVLLGVAAPAVGFGIWGAVDFRDAGRHAEWLRLGEELAISALAAGALLAAGAALLAALLAAASVLHHVLVYALGERLLKPAPAAAGSRQR